MRNKSVWLVVAFVCMLFVSPVSAYADDGFIGGLQDFAGVREVDTATPESDFADEYSPDVREVETRAVNEEEVTVMGQIRNTIQTGMTINMDGTNWIPNEYYYAPFRAVLMVVVPTAVLLVFMWWGVRKSLRMLFAAFRKGRSNV